MAEVQTHQPGDYADDTESFEETRERKKSKHSEWLSRALAVIAALASFSVSSLVYLRDSDIKRFDAQCQSVQQDLGEIRAADQSLRDRVDGIASTVSANATLLRKVDDLATANTARTFSLGADVQRLLNDVDARPDKFTGKMAESLERSLRKDIDRLEREVEVLKQQHYNPKSKH